jgi:hypothetical protein
MGAFDNVDYWVISEVPIGWTNSQRHNAQKAMRNGVGIQSNVQPHLRTELRPITPTQFDEEGEVINDPPPTATAWCMSGDLSTVTRADIVQVIADELQVNYTAVDAKIQIDGYNQTGFLQFLRDNPIWEGE